MSSRSTVDLLVVQVLWDVQVPLVNIGVAQFLDACGVRGVLVPVEQRVKELHLLLHTARVNETDRDCRQPVRDAAGPIRTRHNTHEGDHISAHERGRGAAQIRWELLTLAGTVDGQVIP